MPKVQSFTVTAALPESLEPLRELASNLWWTWNHSARTLFLRISKERSLNTRVNPVEVINSLSSEDIKELEKDRGFLSQLDSVVKSYHQYQQSRTWWSNEAGWSEDTELTEHTKIAYFSLEFGLHESVFLYSGGLGVLAGDYLKAVSDLGIPLVGMGLLYYEGYFSQYLNADGWQQESYPRITLSKQPITPALDANGKEITFKVKICGTDVLVKLWKIEVGLITLYLLDTNLRENQLPYRAITSRLYGGDANSRIQQEIVLGIGGFRALQALGYKADVFHMNEGHSAFLALEQISNVMDKYKLDFQEALLAVRSSNLFTTHTPVPAGNDVFPREMIEQYFQPYAASFNVGIEEILKLGRINEADRNEPFSMTVLALKTSKCANGVSKLHGHVSRKLWHGLWPGLPLDESPIRSITNGIHTPTFTGRDMADLYDRYLGPNWRNQTAQDETWEGIDIIPDEELWRIRSRARSLLVSYCRDRLREQLIRRGGGRVEIERANMVLNPEALTIGFARRFATYKRATLILSDIERLIKIISNTDRPVQFIFAGKAHPADQHGKEYIAKLIHATRRPEIRDRLVFIEDYDMNVARRMVQGVDVWLNNPRRPLEACGTSGMKVAVNGGLNMSVQDGWWFEAFDGSNGWSIGQGEEYDDPSYQDQVESRSIYDLLEREVIPTFFDRNITGVPTEWLRLVKHSIRSIAPRFSASRMAADYATEFYGPLSKEHRESERSGYRDVQDSCSMIERFRSHWADLKVLHVETGPVDKLAIGESLPVKVTANLGSYSAEEIAVQVRYGSLDVTSQIHEAEVFRLLEVQPSSEVGVYVFSGTIEARCSGNFGFSVRLVPILQGEPVPTLSGLITWWD